jgi:hypothetical protein
MKPSYSWIPYKKPHLMPESDGVTTIHGLSDEEYQKDESDCERDTNHLLSVNKPHAQTPARMSASNALLKQKTILIQQ